MIVGRRRERVCEEVWRGLLEAGERTFVLRRSARVGIVSSINWN